MYRENWKSKLGFILAASGSAVGLGNLWKFPYESYSNGGSAFILLYLIAVAVTGLPIMMAEIFIGKSTNRNPIGAFKALHPSAWHFIGWLGILSGFIILSYYSVVGGWTLRYFFQTLTGAYLSMSDQGISGDFVSFLRNGQSQLFFHSFFMLGTIAIVIFGVRKGIELSGKIFMPILVILLLAMVFFSMQTPGFGKSMEFLFQPDFSKITAQSIIDAMGQSFFSLSLGMGAIITYGSYMQKNEPVIKDAITIVFFDTSIAILACLMIFPILFSYKIQPAESIGILFTTLPMIFLKMPAGIVIGPIFFLLVIFAAITSAVSLLEVVVAYFIDEKKWPRKKATLFLGIAIWMLGIPSALSNGGWNWLTKIQFIGNRNFFDTLDYIATNWMLPVGGIFIAIFTGWIVSVEIRDDSFARDHKMAYQFMIFLLKYITPGLVLLILLHGTGVI